MSEFHIDCPHCGTSFDAQIQGDGANMMVFCCARCKTPLMYFHGEVAELDRDEFAGLRKKLSRAIDAVVSNGGAMGAVAEALKKMVDASEALAEETRTYSEILSMLSETNRLIKVLKDQKGKVQGVSWALNASIWMT